MLYTIFLLPSTEHHHILTYCSLLYLFTSFICSLSPSFLFHTLPSLSLLFLFYILPSLSKVYNRHLSSYEVPANSREEVLKQRSGIIAYNFHIVTWSVAEICTISSSDRVVIVFFGSWTWVLLPGPLVLWTDIAGSDYVNYIVFIRIMSVWWTLGWWNNCIVYTIDIVCLGAGSTVLRYNDSCVDLGSWIEFTGIHSFSVMTIGANINSLQFLR